MPVSHILVMLNGLENADAARRTVLAAYDQASAPVALRFALPADLQQMLSSETEENAELPQSALLFYEDTGKLAAIADLVTDESYFLSLMGEFDFSAMWDKELLSRFAKVEYHALLTGTMGAARAHISSRGTKIAIFAIISSV